MGVAVVAGLLFSQLVTLYLTPVYYTYLEAFVGLLRRVTQRPWRTTQHSATPPPAVAAPAKRTIQ